MGDLEDAPMPPMDAETPGMPMDDQNSMGTEPDAGPMMGVDKMQGSNADPMPEDPNSLSAGGDPNEGGDDISSKYQQLSPDQQKAADKYVDSMLNNESRSFIRRAIDETFSSILDDGQEGTERPQKELEDGLDRNLNSPYIPYN